MERTIRVTGRGKISVKPDTIQLSIGASGVFTEYSEAVKRSSEDTELIREAIERAELDSKELKTVRFTVDPEYEGYQDENNNWKQRFVGYRYQHGMYIRFPNDNDILGRVMYELSECPVNVDFSVVHTVKDTEAVKNALLGKAVSDSKEKAAVLAQAATVRLGDIVNIDYSWGELEIYARPMGKMALGAPMMDMAREKRSLDINIEAEDIDVQDTVTVVW
ncbi:MAG: SIMPL domain-containing protein, partial [Oscillospiraceae bacterium]|nr:SIMPL domain-containing protein [Oscillospiraceae bacterium]